MADLTAEELKTKVHAILKGVDLSTTSAKKVRLQLEEELNEDLTPRKEELGKIIQDVLDELEKVVATAEDGEADEKDEDEDKTVNGNTSKASENESDEKVEDEEANESETEEPSAKDTASNSKTRSRGRAPPPAGRASRQTAKKVLDGEDFSDGDFEASGASEAESASESDYEPDVPVRVNRKKAIRRKRRGGSSEEEEGSSSGEEWGKRAKQGKKKTIATGRGRKRAVNSRSGESKVSDSDRPKKKKSVGGFCKSFNLSQELADVVGVKEAPRHEVIKQLWAYIRANNLLDPKNKQFAICDDKLTKLFGVKKLRCFVMSKYLKGHFS